MCVCACADIGSRRVSRARSTVALCTASCWPEHAHDARAISADMKPPTSKAARRHPVCVTRLAPQRAQPLESLSTIYQQKVPGSPNLSCDIHTHTPARKEYTNFQLYYFVMRICIHVYRVHIYRPRRPRTSASPRKNTEHNINN